MKYRRLIVVVIAIACIAVTAGCGPQRAERPDRALVTGKVTYQGKPVPGGIITFMVTTGSGNTAGGMLRADGSFYMEDAPIGENQITIDTEAIKPELGSRYVQLPEKYLSPEKSGLTFDVKAGENQADFALE
jgi:hypothetical protein